MNLSRELRQGAWERVGESTPAVLLPEGRAMVCVERKTLKTVFAARAVMVVY
jgi:hypothetical protein